jgi:hypothetical protein
MIPMASRKFEVGDRVRVPFGVAETAEVTITRTGVGFGFRRKVRVVKDGVPFEIDEDQIELVERGDATTQP